MAYVPLPPAGQRTDNGEAVFSFQPGPHPYFSSVARIRARDVSRLVRRADAWFAARGQTEATWFLGPHSVPTDAAARLEDEGAARLETSTAMLIDTAPGATTSRDIEIRSVATLSDFRIFRRLMFELHDATHEVVAAVEGGTDEAWRQFQEMNGRRELYLASLDGRVAAAGGMAVTEHRAVALSGGATHPAARGRGLYAALVRARWQAAQRLGARTLVTQASAMSRPVLERLGFRAVTEVVVLVRRVST